MSYIEDAPVQTATADYPEVVIEWMPTQGPTAADGDWSPLTQYVARAGGAKTKRGRQFELDHFEAGTFGLSLKTATRLFDPENTSGPFYPWLVQMRQIRAYAVWAGVRYPIFRGYITNWGQTQPDDAMFVTTLTVKDGFERLEQRQLPSSAWALEVLKDDPSCWFRLGETGTVRVTDSSDGGNYGLFDNAQQGAQGLIVNDSDGAAQFAHSLEERVKIQNPALITGYPFTLSMAFKVSGDDPGGFKILFSSAVSPLGGAGSGAGIDITMIFGGNAGLVRAAISDGTNYRAPYFGLSPWDDNNVHLLHFVAVNATTMLAYMDGVLVGLDSTGGTGAPTWPGDSANGYTLGNVADIGLADWGFGVNDPLAVTATNPWPLKERGTIDEFTAYDGIVLGRRPHRRAGRRSARLGRRRFRRTRRSAPRRDRLARQPPRHRHRHLDPRPRLLVRGVFGPVRVARLGRYRARPVRHGHRRRTDLAVPPRGTPERQFDDLPGHFR